MPVGTRRQPLQDAGQERGDVGLRREGPGATVAASSPRRSRRSVVAPASRASSARRSREPRPRDSSGRWLSEASARAAASSPRSRARAAAYRLPPGGRRAPRGRRGLGGRVESAFARAPTGRGPRVEGSRRVSGTASVTARPARAAATARPARAPSDAPGQRPDRAKAASAAAVSPARSRSRPRARSAEAASASEDNGNAGDHAGQRDPTPRAGERRAPLSPGPASQAFVRAPASRATRTAW